MLQKDKSCVRIKHMLIAGLKLTHDGTLAVAKDDQLLFSVELEKLNNNQRYKHFDDLNVIEDIFADFNITYGDIDHWVIDGWEMDPENGISGQNVTCVGNAKFEVNSYCNCINNIDEGISKLFSSEQFGSYASYTHIYDHLCSAYCTSEFALNNESAFIIVFDGGTKPLLFYYDIDTGRFVFCKELLKFGGDIYSGMASYTPTFSYSKRIRNGVSTFTQKFAGRVMAYIACGSVIEELMDLFQAEYEKLTDNNCISNGWEQNRKFEKNVFEVINQIPDEDVLLTFHMFLQCKLCEEIKQFFESDNRPKCRNLCLCGGNFLNIKWNSAIREMGVFDKIYAPPFINDSGVAIGAICAKRMELGIGRYLNWNLYSGPMLKNDFKLDGWNEKLCTVSELARFIAERKQPVLILSGRSELGPRALGNRSIIADARLLSMKDTLNIVKNREAYRPVAPICLEEDSKLYFIPGGKDEYMLFEHQATEFGASVVPAIFHIDGTARLQTVTKESNETIYELLKAYKGITGISVLCNTSANYEGKGFFPDLISAQKWGKVNAIWNEGILYYKEVF